MIRKLLCLFGNHRWTISIDETTEFITVFCYCAYCDRVRYVQQSRKEEDG